MSQDADRPKTIRDENAALVRRAHQAFLSGDVATLAELFDDNITWHAPGKNQLAGHHVGRAAVDALFGRMAALTDSYWTEGLDYLGGERTGCLFARVAARRGDRALETYEHVLFRIEGGRLVEAWHIPLDERAWDEFFA